MKKLQITLFFFLIACINSLSAQDMKAEIKIDAQRKIGHIDSLIYGNFTEHLGRCIYGGIYDPSSKQANEMDSERTC